MKYMLMMNTPGNGPYQVSRWPPQDIKAHIGFMIGLHKKLSDAGEKESLAGYWIIDVDGPERASQIAAEASAAPGPGGTPMNMAIEVRQVMSGPPKDLL